MPSASQTETLDPQLFQDVFNASPIGIAVENLEGQPLFVNPALCSMLGFSENEMRSKHCVDFSPPEDAAKDWELFQQLRAGAIDHYQVEKRYFRRDGSLVWGSLSVSLLNICPSPLVIAMVEDITAKKKAEEAQFRHAAIVGSSEDAIASVTLDGVIVSWNAGAQHIYGYTEAEAVGKSVKILVPPELAEEENNILERLRAGEPIKHYETVRLTKAGKRLNVSLSLSPIKDASGAIVGLSGIARDISELKRHEQELRASEGRLRLAQQAARIGTFERDVRTGGITWTERLESLYGLPPDSVHGQTPAFFNDLIHPADRETVAHLIQEALKTGQPTEGEWRVIWPDGSVHWIAGRWQVLMDESGEPSRVVGVNMDVTERKLAEQALHAHEELLKIFVKNVPAAVAMLDRDMHYLQVSDRWCTDYLSGRAQVLGRSHYELFPDMPERWKEVHRRALAGETLRADEDHWEGRDGPHWARWEVRPWKTPEGTVGGILILAEDITERKRAEEAVKESETRFRLVADTAPVMIWMSGPDKKPTYFNQLWLDFTGFSHTDLQNRLAELVHPEDYLQCHEVYCRGFDQRQPFRKECRLRRHDGQYRWMLDIGVPRFHKDGSFAGYIGSCIDITQHKQAEEAISGVTRKLVEAQEQERARIARELHDDINQRLAMLSVELEQLQDDPSEVRNRVQELRKQTTEISNGVQALSHDLHSSQLEYLGAVAGIKSWCTQVAERHKFDIDFRSDLSSALPLEIGLPLFRVLQESVNNAIKHSGQKRLEVQLREDSREVHMLVRDSGVGFDLERALLGKGLGLTSMRERVRLLNGTITIESEPNDGTTIHVRVPLGQRGSAERLAS